MPEIKKTHNLAPYSCFGIGGPADFFAIANSSEEAIEAFDFARRENLPFFIFGGGSNLLFDDAGFRGLVLKMQTSGIHTNGTRIFAEAGVTASALVNTAAKSGLSGLEAWKGLPGTVGGAVFGNAGCFGTETADILESADIYFHDEGLVTLLNEDLHYLYRQSALKADFMKNSERLPEAMVLSAIFNLQEGDEKQIRLKMSAILDQRKTKQSSGKNTGSYFKNPAGHHAGRLIEECGLKGKVLGGAEISTKHANFFMNKGEATAKDILDLAALTKKAVKDRHGIDLETEVIFVPAHTIA